MVTGDVIDIRSRVKLIDFGAGSLRLRDVPMPWAFQW